MSKLHIILLLGYNAGEYTILNYAVSRDRAAIIAREGSLIRFQKVNDAIPHYSTSRQYKTMQEPVKT